MTHDHIVRSHDEEQQRLRGDILRMGELAAAQLADALDAVERRDEAMARRVVDGDTALDRMEQAISRDVLQLALRGPLAGDLRLVMAALRVITDIERIGDYAANVAKRALVLNQSPPLPHTRGLRLLGDAALDQVRRVLRAYAELDVAAALEVRTADAGLDAQHTGLFRELLTYMMEDPRHITACTHLLFMAKNLERIGDHATNIAESIWFRVEGDAPLPERDKRDGSSASLC